MCEKANCKIENRNKYKKKKNNRFNIKINGIDSFKLRMGN